MTQMQMFFKMCIHQRMKSCCDFVFIIGIKYNSFLAENNLLNSIILGKLIPKRYWENLWGMFSDDKWEFRKFCIAQKHSMPVIRLWVLNISTDYILCDINLSILIVCNWGLERSFTFKVKCHSSRRSKFRSQYFY